MPRIHPTAVVDPGAQLGHDVEIGPFCIVGPKVTIGDGTRLISHVSILNRTTLGRRNTVWPFSTLGGDPQDLKFHGEDAQLVIGDDNDLRESVTIHIGTENGGGFTRVGSNNLLMVGVHIAHDCLVGNHVIMANSVGLAGHVCIEDYANIGGAVGVHHFVTFGRNCFIGGMSRIVQDVPPYMIIEGSPGAVRGVNVIGLERCGFDVPSISRLKEAFRRIYRAKGAGAGEGNMPGDLGAALRRPSNMADRLAQLEADFPDDPHIAHLIQFLRNSTAGVYGRYREGLRQDNRHRTPVK